jgi:site-specific DNA recombinase
LRRERPPEEWITTEHPDLAIIDRATWDAAQRRIRGQSRPLVRGRPMKHLLSGLLRCGDCGGPMVIVDRYRYGCSVAKERGTCTNSTKIAHDLADKAMLAGIVSELLSEQAFRAQQRAVATELKKAAPSQEQARRALAQEERERDNIMAAIRQGIFTPTTKAELVRAENAVSAASAAIAQPPPTNAMPRLRERMNRLAATLADRSRTVTELRELLRGMIGSATLRNDNGALVAEVAPCRIALVAGVGFEPTTFGL